MALHVTPEKHEAEPPSSWQVRKVAPRRWKLCLPDGGVIDTFTTKRAAEDNKVSGRWVELYEKEGRWFAGEPVQGWKPYAPLG